jgi:hypothetical protein
MSQLTRLRTAVGVALLLATVLAAAAVRSWPADDHDPRTARDRPATLRLSFSTPFLEAGSPAGAVRQRPRTTTLDVARRIAKSFRLTITSGYRDAEHNLKVGGAEGSYHTRGTRANPGAVDLVGSAADMRRALDWAQRKVGSLAEGMIHAVCLVDDTRPWRVSDAGLHLHLAFHSRHAKRGSTPYIIVALHSGCQAAADRFRFALRAIRRLRSTGSLTAGDAARASLTASTVALDGAYGTLGKRGRAIVLTARRRARDLLDRAIAARRSAKPSTKVGAYKRYVSLIERTDERERRGAISALVAAARRRDAAEHALAGDYGELTATQREKVQADRAALDGPPEEQNEQTSPSVPPATAPAPVAPGMTESVPAPVTTPPPASTVGPTQTGATTPAISPP